MSATEEVTSTPVVEEVEKTSPKKDVVVEEVKEAEAKTTTENGDSKAETNGHSNGTAAAEVEKSGTNGTSAATTETAEAQEGSGDDGSVKRKAEDEGTDSPKKVKGDAAEEKEATPVVEEAEATA